MIVPSLPGRSTGFSLRRFMLSMAVGLMAIPASAQSLWSESFETDGNGTRYTATEFSDGSGDFFTRTDGSNITGSYSVTGADGSSFFAAMDTDGEPAGGDIVSITFSPIDINGFSSLSFSGLFAEDDDGTNQDWDDDALVYVEANIDGAGWTKILQFATGVSGFNQEPLQDTDLDGVGDGAALTDAFASFSAPIPGAGSSLELRITTEFLDAGDEDVAFDLLEVSGTPAGPSMLWVEDFETDGNGSRYTAAEFSDGFGDFFTRTDGSNIGTSYQVTGNEGSFFFAGMDTDGEPEGGDVVSITFDPININGFSSLSFSGLFAEDDDGTNQDWDDDALVYVEANIDGAGWTKILQFATGTPGFNQEPLQDTDLDGVGDGAALTAAFATFSANISGTGTLLEFRITSEFLDAGDEDIAFDFLKVEGVQTGGGCTDAAAPMAVCQNVTLYLDANGQAVLDPADLDGGSTDDCTPAELLSFSASQTSFDCSDMSSAPVANGLFISEYVEGSGFTKYVEVFNGTGNAVDLSNFELRLYANGNTSPNSVTQLSGMLADGEVVVLANSQATEYSGPVQVISAVNFNGDDAVELYNTAAGQTMDIFGTIGEDPGSQWSAGGNSTQNATLRRKSSVTMGVQTNPGPGFPTLATEWDGFANNDVSGLGSHSLGSGGIPVTLTVADESGKSSTCVAQVTVMDNLGPNVICTSPTLVLDENGQASLTADMVDGGTVDNCSDVTLSIDKMSFDCADAAGITTGDDIFISEYVEGSGFTKYVELYNGTGSTVDLSNYEFRLYSNGSSAANSVQTLSGTLANGQVVVLANPSATSYGGATQILSAVNFNGDDAVEIYNTATSMTADIFGTIGEDPGSQWSAGGNSTQNATLRRKSSVAEGVTTNPGPGFPTLATEWDSYANNDISGLGMHMVDQLPGIPVTLTATDDNGNVSTCTALVNVVDNTMPVVTCQDINIQLDANGNATIAENAVDDGSYDNCGPLTFDTDITSFTTADIGANAVVLTVTDPSGNSATCNATVNVFAPGPAVFEFVLYDARDDVPIMTLNDGDYISLPELPTNTLAIRALPGTDLVESMELILTGPESRTQTENNAPYFSFGDNIYNGNINGKGFPAGVYTFSATPYSQDKLQGVQGATRTITFELFVPTPEILSFDLINPSTDQVVGGPMMDGDVVNLTALGGSFSIRANANLGDIEEVEMVVTDMNGQIVHDQTEGQAEYLLFGNYGSDYQPGSLPDGMYTLTATPIEDNTSNIGISASVDFVVTGNTPPAGSNGLMVNQLKGNFDRDIHLYPNPASHVLNADLSEFMGESARMSIMNEIGQEVWALDLEEIQSDPRMINLSAYRFTEGVYLFHLETESGMQITRRFVIVKN